MIEKRINKKIIVKCTIIPVSATRRVTYDISKMIDGYIRMGKTKEEALEDFKCILKEVCRELSEERGFE